MHERKKERKKEAKSKLDKYSKKLSGKVASLKEYVAKYHKGEFTGWAVSHRFRHQIGTITIPSEMIFFCNKEFTTCIGYEADQFEDFINILETVDDATSDEDILDYFKENRFSLF